MQFKKTEFLSGLSVGYPSAHLSSYFVLCIPLSSCLLTLSSASLCPVVLSLCPLHPSAQLSSYFVLCIPLSSCPLTLSSASLCPVVLSLCPLHHSVQLSSHFVLCITLVQLSSHSILRLDLNHPPPPPPPQAVLCRTVNQEVVQMRWGRGDGGAKLY